MSDCKTDLSMYEGIPQNTLPKVWFPFYVVYRYSYSKYTSIVGFYTDVAADEFQKELLTKQDVVRCEIFGHYPLELLRD